MKQKPLQRISILLCLICLILGACSGSGGSSGSAGSHATVTATGPLRVDAVNPRYFSDGNGKTVLLSGFEFWDVLLADGQPAPEAISWISFLEASRKHNTNFIRLWVWNELTRFRHAPDAPWYTSKEIWMRTGPGLALDEKPKFDLTKFNQAYFDELRARVSQAAEKGFYVSVMLFEGWSLRYMEAPWNWNGHPFNPRNNIQNLNGDVDGDSLGTEVHTLEVPEITRIQEQYVKKVIDTLNDLDNVLFEICNEDHEGSTAWQYHMIAYIRDYEKNHKPKQHPVWMSTQYVRSDPGVQFNTVLLDSPADCISPNPYSGYKDDPPAADGRKIIISDSDHLCGCILDHTWVWKSFTRGLNIVNYMELPELLDDNTAHIAARNAMGHVLQYANRIDLSSMIPSTDLSSTKYCLANPGKEYIVYQPEAGKNFTLLLPAGRYEFEWFNPSTGRTGAKGVIETGGARESFSSPFGGDAVLYIYRSI